MGEAGARQARTLLAAVAVWALTGNPAAAQSSLPPTSNSTSGPWNWSVPVKGPEVLDITHVVGSVKVWGRASSAARISVRRTSHPDDPTGPTTLRPELRRVGQSIQLRVIDGEPRLWDDLCTAEQVGRLSPEGLDIEVDVPRHVQVRVRSVRGTVEVVGVQGASNLITVDGDIYAQDLSGQLDVETRSGEIELVRPTGPFTAESARGETLLRLGDGGAGGKASSRSGPMRIFLEGRHPPRLRLTSRSGSIEGAPAQPGGPHSTPNRALVDVHTVTGSIRVEGP